MSVIYLYWGRFKGPIWMRWSLDRVRMVVSLVLFYQYPNHKVAGDGDCAGGLNVDDVLMADRRGLERIIRYWS